jgi:hypothetical protein
VVCKPTDSHLPVVFIVQELVSVVVQDPWLLLVLLKLLHGRARKEAAVGRVDAPGQVSHDLRGRGRLKLVQLAVEGVEDGVEPAGDVPLARELGRVKRLDDGVRLGGLREAQ